MLQHILFQFGTARVLGLVNRKCLQTLSQHSGVCFAVSAEEIRMFTAICSSNKTTKRFGSSMQSWSAGFVFKKLGR
jgi:hypothetical protein